jgi:hypothetical protein
MDLFVLVYFMGGYGGKYFMIIIKKKHPIKEGGV